MKKFSPNIEFSEEEKQSFNETKKELIKNFNNYPKNININIIIVVLFILFFPLSLFFIPILIMILKKNSKNKDKYGNIRKSSSTIFKGVAFDIPYYKSTKSPIKIIASQRIFTSESTGKYIPKIDGWHKIETESVAFNDNFEAYSQTDIGGFYTLTPTLIENLLKLKEKYGLFGCYINGNRALIAFEKAEDDFAIKNIENITIKDECGKYTKILNWAVDVSNSFNS